MIRTPYKRTKVINALAPASQTGDVAGTAVDTKGWQWLRVLLHLGAEASSEAITLKLQHCATSGGSYVDVPSGPTIGPISAAGSDGDKPKEILVYLPTAGLNRYVKPAVTQTGSGSFVYGVSVHLSEPISTDLATQTPDKTLPATGI